MKAIIYAGIGLFSVATVYGLADYYSSQKKGTLNKLYAEEESAPTPAVETKTTAVIPVKNVETEPAEAEAKTVIANVKSVKKYKASKRKIEMEDFSRARIPETIVREDKIIEEPVKKEAVVITEKITVEPAEKVEVKEEVLERKISMDKFSRAPLKKPVKKVALKN